VAATSSLSCLCAKDSCEAITVLSAGTRALTQQPAPEPSWTAVPSNAPESAVWIPVRTLAGFNAYPFFQSWVMPSPTGSTGNNLRDLRGSAGH